MPFELGLEPALVKLAVVAYRLCVRPDATRNPPGGTRLQKEEDSDDVADHEVDHPLRQRHAQIKRDNEGAPRAVWRDLVGVGVGVGVKVKVRVRVSWRHLVGVGVKLGSGSG